MNKINIKSIGNKISSKFKVLMLYMSLIAVILCSINLIYFSKIESDVEDLEYRVIRINTDYDNSDVINAIENAEGNIIRTIEDSEDNIKRNIIIWSN